MVEKNTLCILKMKIIFLVNVIIYFDCVDCCECCKDCLEKNENIGNKEKGNEKKDENDENKENENENIENKKQDWKKKKNENEKKENKWDTERDEVLGISPDYWDEYLKSIDIPEDCYNELKNVVDEVKKIKKYEYEFKKEEENGEIFIFKCVITFVDGGLNVFWEKIY